MDQVAQSLGELAEAFSLSRQVSGCTGATLTTYRRWLSPFRQEVGEAVDPLSVRRFFAKIQERGLSHSSVHQAYRSVKTFLRTTLSPPSESGRLGHYHKCQQRMKSAPCFNDAQRP